MATLTGATTALDRIDEIARRNSAKSKAPAKGAVAGKETALDRISKMAEQGSARAPDEILRELREENEARRRQEQVKAFVADIEKRRATTQGPWRPGTGPQDLTLNDLYTDKQLDRYEKLGFVTREAPADTQGGQGVGGTSGGAGGLPSAPTEAEAAEQRDRLAFAAAGLPYPTAERRVELLEKQKAQVDRSPGSEYINYAEELENAKARLEQARNERLERARKRDPRPNNDVELAEAELGALRGKGRQLYPNDDSKMSPEARARIALLDERIYETKPWREDSDAVGIYDYIQGGYADGGKTWDSEAARAAIYAQMDKSLDDYSYNLNIVKQASVYGGMADDEREQFESLIESGDNGAIKRYAKDLRAALQAREAAREGQAISEMNIPAQVAMNIYSGMGAGFEGAIGVAAALSGEEIDPNSPLMDNSRRASQSAQSITDAAYEAAGGDSGGLRSKAVRFLAQTGLSIANNATNLALGPAGLYAMSMEAAGQNMYQNLAEGLSTRDAVLLGAISGAIEYVTEKIPFDNVLAALGQLGSGAADAAGGKAVKSALKAYLGQVFTEGAEEAASEIMNAMADHVVTGRPIDIKELAKSTAFSALGGGISGGVFGIPVAAAQAQANRAARGADSTTPGVADTQDQGAMNRAPTDVDARIAREYEAAVDPDILGFAEDVMKGGRDGGDSVSAGTVDATHANALQQLTGTDYTGFKVALTADALRHINNRHGVNGAADQSMADANDVARMRYVIENFDGAQVTGKSPRFYNSDGSKADTILLEKRIDGHYYVAEAVPDAKSKTIYVLSAYRNRNLAGGSWVSPFASTSDNGPANAPVSDGGNTASGEWVGQTPPPNVQNAVTSTPATDSSIQQNGGDVNALGEDDVTTPARGATPPTEGNGTGEFEPVDAEFITDLFDESDIETAQRPDARRAAEIINAVAYGGVEALSDADLDMLDDYPVLRDMAADAEWMGVDSGGAEAQNGQAQTAASQNGEVNQNGGQVQRGTAGADSGQGRVPDVADAIADGSAGAEQGEYSAPEAGRAADQRRNLLPDHGAQAPKVSPESLGIKGGAGYGQVTELPQSVWDEGLKSIAAEVKEATGGNVRFVLGSLRVRGGYARGALLENGDMVIQADDTDATAEQIARHELFHAAQKASGGSLVNAVREEAERLYPDDAAIQAAFDAYYNHYSETFAGRHLTREQVVAEVMEEIFADAYAGINSFGVDTSRWAAPARTATTGARQAADAANEAATARTTGPPGADNSEQITDNGYGEGGGEKFGVADGDSGAQDVQGAINRAPTGGSGETYSPSNAETAERAQRVLDMEPQKVKPRGAISKSAAEELARSFGTMENENDGRAATLPIKSVGKILRNRGFDISTIFRDVPELYETALPAWTEPEIKREGHKEHGNINAYHHYINTFTDGNGEYYIRFTVTEMNAKPHQTGDNFIHSTAISDVDIYKKSGSLGESGVHLPATSGEPLPNGSPRSAPALTVSDKVGQPPFIDTRLQQFFDSVNTQNSGKNSDDSTKSALTRENIERNLDKLPKYSIAYHGTPYSFDEFLLDHIGSGEGGQAHGWGLYFAANRETSERYRDELSESVEKDARDMLYAHPDYTPEMFEQAAETYKELGGKPWLELAYRNAAQMSRAGKETLGNVYTVDIPDEDVMLREDLPLSEQPAKVKGAISRNLPGIIEQFDPYYDAMEPELPATATGRELYNALSESFDGDSPEEEASRFLNDIGIKGIVYDGRQDGKSYVVFDDKAIKILDDAQSVLFEGQPLYSLSEPIEETRDLIAAHNLTVPQLMESVRLGGFAMPSIAVTRSGISHDRYGDVTVLFDNSTIDPKRDRRNKVYGGDAWTPSFPEVGYEADKAVLKNAASIRERLIEKYGLEYGDIPAFNADEIASDLRRSDGDLVSFYKNDDHMRLMYALDAGLVEPAYKAKDYGVAVPIEFFPALVEAIGADRIAEAASGSSDLTQALAPIVTETANKMAMEEYNTELFKKEIPFGQLDQVVDALAKYIRNGEQQTLDPYVTRDKVNAALANDEQGYVDWLNGLFENVVTRRGLRNNKDLFTPSGNRRSFKQLYDEIALDNIVKKMAQEAKKGGSGGFDVSFRGASSREYRSINDIRADKGRLRHAEDAEMKALVDGIDNRVWEIAGRLGGGSFDVYEAITEAVSKSIDPDRIYKSLSEWTQLDATPEIAREISALAKEAAEIPTEYFEAKPHRAVGLEEAKAVIVPDNISDGDLDTLKRKGFNVSEYKAGDSESRRQAVNGAAQDGGIMFSLSPAEYAKLDTAIATEPEYAEIRKFMRTTPISFAARDRGDGSDYGFDSYNDMRKQYLGRLKLVNEGGETPDGIYQELQSVFGKGFFPDDVTNPMDKWRQILDVVDEAYDNKKIIDDEARRVRELHAEARNAPNSSEAFNDELVSDRLAMLADLRSLGEELDRDVRANRDLTRQGETYERRIARLKENAKERVGRVKAEGRERVAKVRAQRDKKIEGINYTNTWKKLLAKQSRDNTVQRGKIRKTLKELDSLLRHPTDTKHIPEHMRAAVADFLAGVNLDSPNVSDAGRVKLDDLRRMYKEMADNGDTSLYLTPELAEKMDAASKAMKTTPLNKLDSNALGDLLDVARGVTASVKFYNKMFKEGAKLTVSSFAGEVMRDNYGSARAHPHKISTLALGRAFGKFFNSDLIDSFSMFRELGTGMDTLFRDLRAGFDTKVRDVQWAQKALGDALEGVDRKKLKQWRDKARGYKTDSGKTIDLTDAQLMSLYVQSRQDQALSHYFGGGITTTPDTKEMPNGKKKVTKTYTPVQLTPNDLDRFINALGGEQKDVAERLAALFDKTAAWGNEVSMTLYGYKKFVEKHYFPIVSDSDFLSDTFENLGSTQQLINLGETKSRVKGANNPIVVEDIFTVAARQLDHMSSYHAFVIPLADMERVMNYRGLDVSVKNAIGNNLGKEAVDYVTKFMRDVNGGGRGDSGGLYEKVVRGAKGAALGANVRVIIQQPTAILRAAAMLDPKYLAQGATSVKGSKSNIETVMKYSPIAAWRGMGFYSLDTGRQMEDIIMGKHSFSEVMMAGIGKADELTWKVIWNAVEHETAAKNKSLKVGSGEFYEAVAKRFDDIIDRTQVVDTVFHRAQMMRSDNALVKRATAFMSEGVKTYNMLRSAAIEADTPGGKRKLIRTVASVLSSTLLASLVRSAWDVWRDKEKKEDETTVDKFFRHLLGTKEKVFIDGDLVSSAFGMLPYMNDLVSMFQGYGADSMEGEAVGRAYDSIKNLVKSLIDGEDSKMTPAFYMKNAAGAVSALFGLPIKNAIREAEDLGRHALDLADKPMLEYNLKKFYYSVNNSPGEFYDILFSVSPYGDRPDPKAYADIQAAMLRDGGDITQQRIDTAMRNRVLDKSLIKNKVERSKSALSGEISAFEAYKMLTPEQIKQLDENIAAVARGAALDENTDIDVNGVAAAAIKARKSGIPEAAYLLFAQVRQLYDEPEGERGHGSYSNAEIADAIDAMTELTDEQKSSLWQLGETEDKAPLNSKLRDAGIGAKSANAMTAAVARLTPLDGHETVTAGQRYEAVLRGDYTASERDKAMSVLVTQTNDAGEKVAYEKYKAAMKTGLSVNSYLTFRENGTALNNYLEYSDNGASRAGAEKMASAVMKLKKLDDRDDIQALQRYAAIVNSGVPVSDQMAGFRSHMQASEYYKIEAAAQYGVTPAVWVQYRGNIFDIDANGSVDQAEATQAIRAIPGLDRAQRAALWQVQNKSWAPRNNPFGNTSALRAVLDAAPKEETVKGTNPVTGKKSA